mgnify:CR=1 FL=1
MQDTAFKGVEFPYVAKCPSNGRRSEFGSITDVYDEIIRIYEEAESKGFNVGESVYSLSFYFSDHDLLVDSNMQNRIKEYQFCKAFSCSPCPTLQETSADIVDDFFIIEEEYNHCIKKQQEEKKDA